MTFIKYWTKILSYELSKKISKCPKWGFTCIKTEISAKLWCCSDYFEQITRVFNHFLFLSSIMEFLPKFKSLYELGYSLRMGQSIVHYSDYLILNIVMYFQKISY